jgi:hypothetical protein
MASLSRWFKSLVRVSDLEMFTALSTRAHHPVNPDLERKIAAAREVAPPLQVAERKTPKPKLIVETDTFVAPRPFDDESLF